MNREALEYWIDGHDIDVEKYDWGYVIEQPGRISNGFIREIGACGACIHTGTVGELLIVDPSMDYETE